MSGVMQESAWATACSSASAVLALSERKNCFSLAQAGSMSCCTSTRRIATPRRTKPNKWERSFTCLRRPWRTSAEWRCSPTLKGRYSRYFSTCPERKNSKDFVIEACAQSLEFMVHLSELSLRAKRGICCCLGLERRLETADPSRPKGRS